MTNIVRSHYCHQHPHPAAWAVELDTILNAVMRTWMAASNRAVARDVLGVGR
jgi:hypothetical protein